MPEISKENVTNTEWLSVYRYNRFVRIGNVFYYSENYRQNHASIAIENGITKTNDDGCPIVDDGGEIQIVNGKLAFGGFTISCAYKDEDGMVGVREETRQIAKKIFGENNIY